MSYSVFFSMSSGLAKPITVPAGTLRACQEHVARVERVLGFETTQYKKNPPHWKSTSPKAGVDDKVFCKVATQHNDWVRWLHGRLAEWAKATKKNPIRDGWHPRQCRDNDTEDASFFVHGNYGKPTETERLTPKGASTFWHGLREISVPVGRWTSGYYRSRMEHLYEVMRGRENEGVTFDVEPLDPRQAAQVVNLLATYLDDDDLRLDVPRGRDHLASSADGGYDWCSTHGAVSWDDGMCCEDDDCDLRRERLADDRESE